MVIHLDITVSGHVQGVYFRASTKARADALGISGFVRNEPGGVYLEAEGEEEALKELLAWLAAGPPAARVDHVKSEEGAVQDFSGFEIRR